MTANAHETLINSAPIRLLIHGGAGAVQRDKLSAEREQAYRLVMAQSLMAGHAILAAGGSSIEAVIAAITVMEDSPLFNAGHGAVFTHNGRIELDASIMDGANRMAGAVAGVTTTRNPILAAHAVMARSNYVLLIGEGADQFAAEQGLNTVDPSYFHTQHRWDQLQRAIAKNQLMLDHDTDASTPLTASDEKHGTVGALALDRHGNLAAGTSTGGLTNKRFGRVGDSPIIGAGTYADNRSVAVSATGTGEMFIRTCAAFHIAEQVRMQKTPLPHAIDQTLADIAAMGGEGGLIGLDAHGHFAMRFNTSAMFRGLIAEDGIAYVAIFPETEASI